MYLAYRDADQVTADLVAASGQGRRWLLCVADRHADELPALLAACDRQDLDVCGGIFPGLIEGGRGRDGGIVAMPLPYDCRIDLVCLGKDSVEWAASPPQPGDTRYASSIMLVDYLAPNIDGLMDEVFDRHGGGMHHIGAAAGFRDMRAAPAVFTRAGLHPHAALMISLPRQLALSVRHGWKRVAGPFVVSRAQGNVIHEMDWEPAGSFYRNQVGLLNPSLRDAPVYPDLGSAYPLCIAKEGSEDIMRDPIRITDADEVVVSAAVAENSVVYLAHGNQDTLIEAARQAAEACPVPSNVERCFVCDCYSRALILGDAFDDELAAARAALHADIELEGVQAQGEIAANGSQKLEFFNLTFVIGLLHPTE